MSEIIPVIHMLNEEQVFTNVDTCIASGIEKIFIINHAVSTQDLLSCAFKVRDKYDIWTGVNMLGTEGRHAIQIDWNLDGIWCDETLKFEDVYPSCYEGMVFSGLAFKYQPQPLDLKKACEEIKPVCNVATTSGVGTGQAANIAQIHRIRAYLGDFPMAIASGISAENVKYYKDIADYLLVASSITDSNELIIADKLKELKDKL